MFLLSVSFLFHPRSNFSIAMEAIKMLTGGLSIFEWINSFDIFPFFPLKSITMCVCVSVPMSGILFHLVRNYSIMMVAISDFDT